MALSADHTLPIWDSENIYFSGQQWFVDLLQDIASARASICLQTYIFSLDHIGIAILQSLCDASLRGVNVRVIVDGVGSASALDALEKKLHAHQAELHIYNPAPWRWAANRREPDAWFTRLLARLGNFNNRLHSKLCLIDDCLAWTGSFNITADHLGNADSTRDWKDSGVRVSGKRCLLLREFFDAVWYTDFLHFLSRRRLHLLTGTGPLLRYKRLRTLLMKIHNAHQRIWISSAYFSPTPRVVRALKKAGARGIDIHLVVPSISDVYFFPALASTYYADLLRAGIHIHEFENGILHTKHMLIDDEVTIGSSNMNHRSILHDVELDIELYDPRTSKQIEQDILASMLQSREITLGNINRFYAWLLAFGHIPRLLRYWL
jgi:cardiolipin synthase